MSTNIEITEDDMKRQEGLDALQQIRQGIPFEPDLRTQESCARKTVWECNEDPACDFEMGRGCSSKVYNKYDHVMSNYEWGKKKYHAFYKDRPAPAIPEKYLLARNESQPVDVQAFGTSEELETFMDMTTPTRPTRRSKKKGKEPKAASKKKARSSSRKKNKKKKSSTKTKTPSPPAMATRRSPRL